MNHQAPNRSKPSPSAISKAINKYITLRMQGSGNAMRPTGSEGVRQSNFQVECDIEARIPIDKLLQDTLLRLKAGGYAYGGRVKLPQAFQDEGAPASIKYGDQGFTNLGIGLSNKNYSIGAAFNPQTLSKSINARFQVKF